VPTPITTAKQGTIIRYLVRKGEDGTHRGLEAQPTPQSSPPREALGSEGSDTPNSEVATPRGQSPETVDREDAVQGCPVDWGSASEADEAPTRLTEMKQLSGPPLTDNTDGHREAGAQPTATDETPDRNDIYTGQREHAAMYNWRVDLTDNRYKYDRLLEPAGPTEGPGKRDTPFRITPTLNLQPIRTLTYWADKPPGSG